jgi:hypothetical protein
MPSKRRTPAPTIVLGVFAAISACVGTADTILAEIAGGAKAMTTSNSKSGDASSRFATLDDYLAHLAKGGAMDRPYYHRLPDGRYQLIAGRGSNRNPQFFTRDELLRKFGFAK